MVRRVLSQRKQALDLDKALQKAGGNTTGDHETAVETWDAYYDKWEANVLQLELMADSLHWDVVDGPNGTVELTPK